MPNLPSQRRSRVKPDRSVLERAYYLMSLERHMARLYDEHRDITIYVHATALGHEAIQLATAFHLTPDDYLSLYYRDDIFLLGLGYEPYDLMLQLLAKKDDPFSGGRSYYAHPNNRDPRYPLIPHQSSATGMQAIPTTGMAHALKYLEGRGMLRKEPPPAVVCSLGDGSITEGEVSEAFQEAVLHQLPILYVVQDNTWSISVAKEEARAMDAYEFAAGFKGMKRMRVDGSDFVKSYEAVGKALDYVRARKGPVLLHVTCPLLGHHTSGVRREYYRSDDELAQARKRDPYVKLRNYLLRRKLFTADELSALEAKARQKAESDFRRAIEAEEPDPATVEEHVFAPTPITEERGQRSPEGGKPIIMVDAARHAIDELMAKHPECLFYGQDVGKRLGGVFREAAGLAEKYGDDRVFNTPIQEAYIFGSTVGMSALGLRPIVEVQFCDYIFTAVNQLVTEIAKSCYLTMGKFPVSAVFRVPIGAYGGGGPYHSGSHESMITNIKGIKVVYPSNAADMKGLLKAAYYDPNPVVIFEHKGLYWSRVKGTEAAKTIEPDEEYVVPIGKGRIFLEADPQKVAAGDSVVVITYGMGVHWALNAAKRFDGRVEILDLRSLNPLDEELIFERVRRHNKALVVSEDTFHHSFALALAGLIQQHCFEDLDAPVEVLGALDLPAVPINLRLEAAMLPSAEKVAEKLNLLLTY